MPSRARYCPCKSLKYLLLICFSFWIISFYASIKHPITALSFRMLALMFCTLLHVSLSCAKAYVLLRHSPRVVLETFMGDNSERKAPEWTRWTNPVHKFQQPLSSFTHLFMHMAHWDCNVTKVSRGLLNHNNFSDTVPTTAWSILQDDRVGLVYTQYCKLYHSDTFFVTYRWLASKSAGSWTVFAWDRTDSRREV